MRALPAILACLLLGACSQPFERPEPPPQAGLQERLLMAETALVERAPSRALARLGRRPAESQPAALRIHWLELRARAQAQAGRPAASIQTHLELLALASGALHNQNWEQQQHERLWQLLLALPDETLHVMHGAAQAGDKPWYQLALLSRTPYQGDSRRVLETWQRDHPQHPANRYLLPKVMRQMAHRPVRPRHIALLLPFSGAFAQAGQAVLNGFLAAWYADEGKRPQLSVHDAHPGSVLKALDEARRARADFIVGPLEKEAISILLREPGSLPPLLTLNYLDTLPESVPDNLVQFGLAPEDEARQVARQARADGHRRALVLSASDALGQRLARVFSEQWTQLGGVVMEQQLYDVQQSDYASPVKALINIDEHEARRDALRRILGRRIYSEHYNRTDADCIFLVGRPQHGRQIMPQLRYFSFGHVPIYSTSHIYSGMQNRQLDSDLNGLRFVDVPWLVSPAAPYPDIADQVEQAWAARQSGLLRLYAMGVDSYRVIPALPRMARQRDHTYRGATGELSLDDNGRLQRRLSWAWFENGAATTSPGS